MNVFNIEDGFFYIDDKISERMEIENFPWGLNKRYNDISTSFLNRFGCKVQKISIDAGFTCPNRDGTLGKGGCTYCNNNSFTPTYNCPDKSITRQLEEGIGFFSRKYKTMRYLAFFQSYTNTYAPVAILKKIFKEALENPEIIGLVIATRPDCLDNEILDYLTELNADHYVLLEMGIESHLDSTLKAINRGHTYAESVDAIERAAARNINTCGHLIIGLPGEGYGDWMKQAEIISKLPVNIIKLHQLQIHRGTQMANQYRKNPEKFNLLSLDEYIEIVVDYLEKLNPWIVVDRFVSQAPPGMVVAPGWAIKNFEFIARLEKRLKERETWQGRLYPV